MFAIGKQRSRNLPFAVYDQDDPTIVTDGEGFLTDDSLEFVQAAFDSKAEAQRYLDLLNGKTKPTDSRNKAIMLPIAPGGTVYIPDKEHQTVMERRVDKIVLFGAQGSRPYFETLHNDSLGNQIRTRYTFAQKGSFWFASFGLCKAFLEEQAHEPK